MQFEDVFKAAVAAEPFPYQVELAKRTDWPDVLVAPTGAGKTAAVFMAWFYRRRCAEPEVRRSTPRRLVFCLPMRVLVTQTAAAIERWLKAMGAWDAGQNPDKVGLHVLMGGSVAADWRLRPEQDAVLVGTQDMLLSRALNRGYAASRAAWPREFGLLSNDCLWVLDEVQLMGSGLATALQLQAFRDKWKTFGPTKSVFMSATVQPNDLETVDHPRPQTVAELSGRDRAWPDLKRRYEAAKALGRANWTVGAPERELAKVVLEKHRRGSRTLVVLNTVARAVAVFRDVEKAAAGEIPVVLLHSRFRPSDRAAALERALAEGFDGIIVSTQVVEAGVDISARTLFAEIAPWPSVVQRVGRCNRFGEYDDAEVWWIDHVQDDERSSAPYDPAEIIAARKALRGLSGASPAELDRAGHAWALPPFRDVVRARDVVDLFDTTPDLGGADLDVARFIREGEDRDVHVFWRDLAAITVQEQARPGAEELCAVPIGEVRQFIGPDRPAFRWDYLEGQWRRVAAGDLRPGCVVMLDVQSGGYSGERGWDRAEKRRVDPAAASVSGGRDSYDDDSSAVARSLASLAEHSLAVRRVADALAGELLPSDAAVAVTKAAHLHDLGKAHPVFQETMRRTSGYDGPDLLAKSTLPGKHKRPHFRHELAGALRWLDVAPQDAWKALVVYLVAAHHGKVRLSLRNFPGDALPPQSGQLSARGVWDGDELPDADLGDGMTVPGGSVSLAAMLLGRRDGMPSWAEMVIALRDEWGPFRLAYLEAIIAAADARGSAPLTAGSFAPPRPAGERGSGE